MPPCALLRPLILLCALPIVDAGAFKRKSSIVRGRALALHKSGGYLHAEGEGTRPERRDPAASDQPSDSGSDGNISGYDVHIVSGGIGANGKMVAKCSSSQETAVLLPISEPCPVTCPFSQHIEGSPCEKVCVVAIHCKEFHPVRFFADPEAMECAPPCAAAEDKRVSACIECKSTGICKRCAKGLFGFTVFELSDDGKHCVNGGQVWWNTFYFCIGLLCLALVAYLAQIAFMRPSDNLEVLDNAMVRRERARAEFTDRMEASDTGFFSASMHRKGGASDQLGGRGVALYFNWLLFAFAVAFVLICAGFFAYELSDLAEHKRRVAAQGSHVCDESNNTAKKPKEKPPPKVFNVSMFQVAEGQSRGLHLQLRASKPSDDGFAGWWDSETATVEDGLRGIGYSTPFAAPHVKGMNRRHQQYRLRMFVACIITYALVTAMALSFTYWQLRYVSGRFEEEPSTRRFTAVVSGLPKGLLDSRRVTAHFRKLFECEDLEELWRNRRRSSLEILWRSLRSSWRPDGDVPEANQVEEGNSEATTTPTAVAEVPLSERFHVIGTSIAYDFYEHQGAVQHEVSSWIEDLEKEEQEYDTGPDPDADLAEEQAKTFPVSTFKKSPRPHFQNSGVQTETRGEILLALHPDLPKKRDGGWFFDKVFLDALGLKEEEPLVLYGSGTAFVTFSTQAARDAAVWLARRGKLPPLRWSEAKGGESTYNLGVEPAPCEPVSIYWENFTSWAHFPQKIALGVLLMLLTVLCWFVLYLPYAMFYADFVLVPGVTPGMLQDIVLGGLIALGNFILSIVIDKVTAWAGFLYKDHRDVAILALAFQGCLLNTVFDLAMVAVVARGVMIKDAFAGKDTGYDTAVAREMFKLIVPGYLLLPYLAAPLVEHVGRYRLARILIRTNGRIRLSHARDALKYPDFDIVWRYADMLNNTTLCLVLLFFTSPRGWKVMCWLLLFVMVVYSIDKYLLLYDSTPVIYDTQRLSIMFSRWWCVPTFLLACLVSFWGYRADVYTSLITVCIHPVAHVIFYLVCVCQIEVWTARREDDSRLYPEVIRELRANNRPWDFFNTNPVYCLRTRCLGAEPSGWCNVIDYMERHGGDGGSKAMPAECVPYVRGSSQLLFRGAKRTKQAGTASQEA